MPLPFSTTSNTLDVALGTLHSGCHVATQNGTRARFREPASLWHANGPDAGFGGLVLAAVFVVLILGLWSARENTISLTRKLAEAVLDDVQSAIE